MGQNYWKSVKNVYGRDTEESLLKQATSAELGEKTSDDKPAEAEATKTSETSEVSKEADKENVNSQNSQGDSKESKDESKDQDDDAEADDDEKTKKKKENMGGTREVEARYNDGILAGFAAGC